MARLRAATERRTVGRTAADLAAAFDYLQEVRLRHQAGRVQAGAAPDDLIALADLGALERRWPRTPSACCTPARRASASPSRPT